MEESTEPGEAPWTSTGTALLIAFRIELNDDFKGIEPKIKLWKMISAKLKEEGYDYSAEKCHNKWRNLTVTYRRNLEKAEVSGMGALKWKFFDVLHKYFSSENISKKLESKSLKNTLDLSETMDYGSSAPSASEEEEEEEPDDPSPLEMSQQKRKRKLYFSFVNYLKKKRVDDARRWKEFKEIQEQKLALISDYLSKISS